MTQQLRQNIKWKILTIKKGTPYLALISGLLGVCCEDLEEIREFWRLTHVTMVPHSILTKQWWKDLLKWFSSQKFTHELSIHFHKITSSSLVFNFPVDQSHAIQSEIEYLAGEMKCYWCFHYITSSYISNVTSQDNSITWIKWNNTTQNWRLHVCCYDLFLGLTETSLKNY